MDRRGVRILVGELEHLPAVDPSVCRGKLVERGSGQSARSKAFAFISSEGVVGDRLDLAIVD
ncbi:hypothetical protein GCM10020255_011920 [Rhodococcus baikonurensis]